MWNKKITLTFHSLIIVSAILLSAVSQALEVAETNLFIPQNKSFANSEVFNKGEQTAYVSMELSEIINPRAKDEHEQKIDLEKPDSPIIVTPSQMIIPAGGKAPYKVFVNEKFRDKDRYYVSLVKEVFGSPIQKEKQKEKQVKSNINMSMSWGVLVVVPKLNPNYATKIESDNNNITFTNKGDSLVLIEDLYICKSDGNCGNAVNYRLFPGETKAFCDDCSEGDEVNFKLIEGVNQKEHVEYIQ
jgi:P pilus assembly chaperone PapD